MSEFCKDCFLKLFGPVDDDEEIIESKEPWLCEGCGQQIPVVDKIEKKILDFQQKICYNKYVRTTGTAIYKNKKEINYIWI